MKKGFTLLELLIVVVILGVLALIAAPTLLNAADQAKNAAVKANVSAAASSITSRFALESASPATDIAGDVATALNINNKNPITGAADPFVAAASGAAGQVALSANDDTDAIDIIGYDKDGVALLTKTVAAPANNAAAEEEAPAE
jgi:type IV pilus assembly protein PilA